MKGADVAVRTLASLVEAGHRDAQLVVIGGPSGPHGAEELESLVELVGRLGIGRQVLFLPPQPHELLSTYYRAADICIVPSRSESFGLVALEAAACGTPVVASAVGGLTTLVEDGVTGYLLDGVHEDGAERAARFAARALELVEDRELADRMGVAASTRARAYTWPMAAARLRRLYSDLTARSLVECG